MIYRRHTPMPITAAALGVDQEAVSGAVMALTFVLLEAAKVCAGLHFIASRAILNAPPPHRPILHSGSLQALWETWRCPSQRAKRWLPSTLPTQPASVSSSRALFLALQPSPQLTARVPLSWHQQRLPRPSSSAYLLTAGLSGGWQSLSRRACDQTRSRPC